MVTKNEASFKSTWRLLRENILQIVWVPCVAHYIDLMLEDISKMEDVHETVEGEDDYGVTHEKINRIMSYLDQGLQDSLHIVFPRVSSPL